MSTPGPERSETPDAAGRRSRLSADRLALLARWKKGEGREAAAAIPRRAAPETEPVPLSFVQQRLWVLDQLVPGSPLYNMPAAFQLSGPLDAGALARALTEVARRHESLRTCFPVVDDEPFQQVMPPFEIALPVGDLTGVAGAAGEAERWTEAEAKRPFDLARGPLLRALLLRLGAEEHLFLITLHHIVADGWSLRRLAGELAELYAAFSSGRPSPLPPLPVQFPDYALWQRRTLRGDALDADVDFWRERLGGEIPVLALPYDRPRPAAPTWRGQLLPFHLGAGTAAALDRLRHDAPVTLFTVLLAGVEAWLHRLSGQTDVVLGTPVANRGRVELEPLIGCFANTLVLRDDLAGDPTFRDLLPRVQEGVRQAMAHQDLPFEKLVEILHPERDLSRNPLFQVMLVLQNTPSRRVAASGLTFMPRLAQRGTAKFDLWISLEEQGPEIAGLVELNRDLFDAATVRRMIGHLELLLAGAAARPDARLSELPLLAEAERFQILTEWNDTAWRFGVEEPLHALFEAQAAREPDAVAVVCEETVLSYGELDSRAERLARHLRALGVGPETPVGVLLERSAALVVALLGILKAGGAYLPLDPGHPPARLALMTAEAAVSVLVTGEGLAELDLGVERKVLIEADGRLPDGAEPAAGSLPTLPMLLPDHPAYVIYTSGSTGRPKGVAVSHRAIVNRLLWMQAAYGLEAGDAVLQKTPFTFDVSVWEFFWPLITGARLVLARPEGHKDSAYLVRLIDERQVTTVHFVPSMLRAFLEEPAVGSCRSLRRVIASGEALPPDLVERFHRSLDAELHNLYGPTEAAVDVTFHPCGPEAAGGPVPIGRPISNLRLHVVDRWLEPVPPGVAGELCIGGVGLARGYLARPDLTAERFVPDPLGGAGGRLYRTGDLARHLADGTLQFLGRLDHQVKIRGFRIELGEVESALKGQPGIQDAVAGALPDGSGGQRLVAWVVPRWQEAAAAAALAGEQVAQWREVFDQAYEAPAGSDASFNLAGWISSETGQPLPPEVMEEWVAVTVEAILALRPRRVLEIGCGTGLLLFRLASTCEAYVGTDISRRGLELVRRQVEERELSSVTLLEQPADDLSGLPPGSFDLVVMSSVVQYFPGAEYLARVLEAAIEVLAPGGSLYLADLRSLPLLPAFHAAAELHRAAPEEPAARVWERARMRLEQEEELVLHPALFTALARLLPRAGRAEVRLRRGRHHTELTRFRYDALLRLDAPPAPPAASRDWQEGWTLADLRQFLATETPPALRLARIPNRRLARTLAALDLLAGERPPATVEQARAAVARVPEAEGIDPEELRDLAGELEYDADLTWSGDGAGGHFDALLRRREAAIDLAPEPPPADGRPLSAWTNDPLRRRHARRLAAELREHLAERLPEAMVPGAFVVLDSLPLGATGKVDRRSLPPPLAVEPGRERGSVAPRTPRERALAAIWEQVLGLERVGVHDNFFELGGDSIKTIQVAARARQAGLALLPRQLFQSQSLADLAAAAEELPALAPVPAKPAETTHYGELAAEAEDAYPVTPWQEEMLHRRLHHPEPGLYVIHHVYDLHSPNLDVAAFAGAWERVLHRHPVLRSRFAGLETGAPFQVVMRRVSAPLEGEDWSGLPAGEQERRLRGYVREVRRTGFDLERLPQSRQALFRCGEESWKFVWTFHYMLQDGWSFPLILGDFLACYEALSTGREPDLPPVPRPFGDFVRWARAQDPAAAEPFWRRLLAGFTTPTPLGNDAAADADAAGDGEPYLRERLDLAPETIAVLEALARRSRTTLNTFIQGAWALVLGAATGERDVVFGSIVSGRPAELEGVEQMVGLFNNLLPVRARLDPAADLAGWLRELQEQQVEVRQHETTPISRIRDWLGLPPERLLFRSYLVFENFPVDPEVPRRAVRLGVTGLDALAQTEHPLRLVLLPGAGLTLIACYYRRCLTAPQVRGLLGGLRTALEAMAADPGCTVGSLLDLLATRQAAD